MAGALGYRRDRSWAGFVYRSHRRGRRLLGVVRAGGNLLRNPPAQLRGLVRVDAIGPPGLEILIARRTAWGDGRKLLMAFIALVPLGLAATVLSLVLNGIIAMMGWQ
nr:hypothetical protein [Nitrosococcus wardiae]